MTPQYNVPKEELHAYLSKLRDQDNTPMDDIGPRDAFELGWETCLHHLKAALGDNPAEIKVSTWDYDSFGKPTLVGMTDYFPTH